MNGNLIPQQRVDRNGKTTRRWVRQSGNGTPAIKAPVVKANLNSDHLSRAMDAIFDYEESADEPEGFNLITVHGNPTFYTPSFALEAMSVLPAKTLRAYGEAMESLPKNSRVRQYLAQDAYDHIREMSDMGQTGAVKAIIAQDTRRMNNTAVFAEVAVVLAEDNGGFHFSQFRSAVEQALASLEGRRDDGSTFGRDLETKVDYLNKSRGDQDHARAYVMAHVLHAEYNTDDYFDHHMVDMVADHKGNWGQITKIARERSFNDMELIRDILTNDTPVVSEGML